MAALDPNTLYYTLSTIAQTLGGILGVLGAVVVLFLQDNDGRTEAAFKKLDNMVDGLDLTEEIEAGEFEKALKKVDAFVPDGVVYSAFGPSTPVANGDGTIVKGRAVYEGRVRLARRFVKHRRAVLGNTRYAACLAVTVIGLAVGLLILTKILACRPGPGLVVLVTMVLLFIAALMKIYDVVAVLWKADLAE